MIKRTPVTITRAAGFTLLEALVALVVISIGLLGLLGLQTVAVVNTQSSETRSLASIAADDIANRIRANPAGAKAGDYNSIEPSGNAGPGPAPAPDCLKTHCSDNQMAVLDAWEWQNTIKTSLNGEGYVRCTAPASPSATNPCRAYKVTVAWSERKAPRYGQPAAHNNADLCDDTPNRIQKRCFITVIQP